MYLSLFIVTGKHIKKDKDEIYAFPRPFSFLVLEKQIQYVPQANSRHLHKSTNTKLVKKVIGWHLLSINHSYFLLHK